MFRSEEDARKAAEIVGSDDAVAERKSAEAKQQDEQRHEAAVAKAEQDKAEKQRKEEGSNETETTEEEVKESPNESAAKEEPKPVEEEPENTVEKQQAAERARETGEPDEAEGEPKPVGKGLFGNIYDQFKGKVKEAVEFLMKHKSGDLLGVFHRSEVGDIDLVWGDDDKGLQHIINGHILVKDPDFKNINEAIFLIDDIVKNSKVVKEGEAKIVFEKDGYRVVICKNINGKQKNWVLTSYDSTNGKGKKRKDCLIVPPLLPLILMKEAGLSLPQTIFLPAKIVQARQMRKRGREKAKKEGTHRQAKL